MRGRTLLQAGAGLTSAAVFLSCLCAQGVTILQGPAFTPSSQAPLAGTLALKTDVPSRVSVTVNDGVEPWQRNFFDYETSHSIILAGFKAHRTNVATVVVTDKFRNTSSGTFTFVSPLLPTNFPTIILKTNNLAMMEPGYTLFRAANATTGGSFSMFVDNNGEVVWYSVLSTPSDVWQMTNGDLFFPLTSETGFEEANLLGQPVRSWTAAGGYPVDSHEDRTTDHGTILYLSYAQEPVANFPSSVNNSNAPLVTTNVSYGRVVEISETNSTLLGDWSLLSMLQPTRVDYLWDSFYSFYGVDPEHANCVVEDTNDNNDLIVSMRNQDAIVKFTRQGQIKWILGPHENWAPEFQQYLLTPVGTPFAWQYAQHAPILTSRGTLLMYDDGNARAEPWEPWIDDSENYSRAVEYSVNETNMTVTQVWQYANTTDDRLYTGFLGNATQLPQTGDVLVTYGAVEYENGLHPSEEATNATEVRLKEVTYEANPQVVFDLELWDPTNTASNYGGYQVYRSRRVPDLYAHPLAPVTDLMVTIQDGSPLLQFSGDPYNNYEVESSPDLVNWTDLGPPNADDANGDYSFQDEPTTGQTAMYYQVLTEPTGAQANLKRHAKRPAH